MRLKTLVRKILPKSMLSRFGVNDGMARFAFERTSDVKNDIRTKYGFDGDLLDLFANNKTYPMHKWHHYIPIYDRYFSNFRGRKIRFLEIGVFKGGSLEMWRKYFGDEAIIFGIDIDPSCKKLDGIAGQVRIGSQDDPEFLETVVREMGGVDVILDDGSHRMKHVLSSFKYLFPKLSDGGIYMIEDLHTAYWRGFDGGYQYKLNFFNFASELIDDMHHWYHLNGVKHPELSSICPAIHIHDSVAVLEKGESLPAHSFADGLIFIVFCFSTRKRSNASLSRDHSTVTDFARLRG